MDDPSRLESYIAALSRMISRKFPNRACDAEDLSQAGRLALVMHQPTSLERARAIVRRAILNEAVTQFFPAQAPTKIKWRAVTARRMIRNGATDQEILRTIGGAGSGPRRILELARLVG